MTLLICGFGPFPGQPDNPAGLTVRRLRDEAWAPPGGPVAYALLPTEWAKAPEAVLAALKSHDARAVLLVGVASRAQAFRVETIAKNLASTIHPDAAGALWPSTPIDADGPDEHPVIAPVEAMRAAIAAEGLAVGLSDDAGDYLCNFTLYRVIAQAGGRPVAFLHVPPVGEAFTLDDIATAVRAAAGAYVGALD